MKQRRLGVSQVLRRFWYRKRGEQLVVITFWPNDYRRGEVYHANGRNWRITRYLRAVDGRFFEVWGREVRGGAIGPAPNDMPARDDS